jgi:hypothetical protein
MERAEQCQEFKRKSNTNLEIPISAFYSIFWTGNFVGTLEMGLSKEILTLTNH